MKSKIPPRLTGAERKAIQVEIRRQCLEQTKLYEMILDTVTLFSLNEIAGFGKERLERFYTEMFKLRREMQERYSTGDDDTIGDFAMFVKLKEKGIDVEKMYEAQEESQRFKVKVR